MYFLSQIDFVIIKLNFDVMTGATLISIPKRPMKKFSRAER